MFAHQGKIKLFADILIGVVAICLIVILVQRFYFSEQSQKKPEVGTTFIVEGVDFSTNKKNIVLVLSKTCRFCKESIPFYNELARQIQFRDVRIIVLMPDSPEVIREYLDSEGLSSFGSHQSSMESLGLSSTPTLIIVDNKGVVVGSWVGKLPHEIEKEVTYKAVS